MEKINIKDKIELLVASDLFETKHINDSIFSLKLSDGPVGLRMPTKKYPKGKPQICLPSISLLANTFNEKTCFNVALCLASQCIKENVDIVLAPGINIKRNPLCGRNFEYFSEDPYLTGKLASSYVNGVQSLGIGTSLKHFCCNNAEYDRLYQSSDVDLRTLKEIYTKAFDMVIKNASPWTIMSSYNALNGINMSENKYALKEILRKQLNYKGVIISDWGAVHNRVEALKASLDIQFPYQKDAIDALNKAYSNNEISDSEIDEIVNRIETLCKKVKENKSKRIALSSSKIKSICIDAICQGSVLLKNDDNILPIKSSKKIALLGGLCYNPSYCGGGSAMIYLKKPIPPLHETLKKDLKTCQVEYSRMYLYASCTESIASLQTMNLRHGYDLAYDSDVTILVVGTNRIIETESYDREELKLPEKMEQIIIETAKRNSNLIVVIEAGAAIDMSSWKDYVKAILYVPFAGSYVNDAIAKMISGKIGPSGRLAETFPLKKEDINTLNNNAYAVMYSEGIYVGYRYYNTFNKEVCYPFGYGLSYNKFTYDNFKIVKNSEYDYEISFDITNKSSFIGYETVQLYISNIDNKVSKPIVELKDFCKVFLKAKETKTINFKVNYDSFSYFNVCHNKFHVDDGRYEIIVAKSSKDYIHTFKVKINDAIDYKKPWEL